MASLDELVQSNDVTLEQLVPEKDNVAPVVSKASNLNLATHVAALSPNPQEALGNYQQMSAELDLEGQSKLADNLLQPIKQEAAQKSIRALQDILISPDYTDEQKRQFVENTVDEMNPMYDVRNLVSQKALTAPVANEEPRAEMQRIDTGSVIMAVNEFDKQKQALLNAELNVEDEGFVKAAGDLVGYMLPFMSQKVAAEINRKLSENTGSSYLEAFTLLGNSKESLREIIAKTPPEDRLEVTQKVIDVINNSSTIVMPDGNDFARKDFLQAVLGNGTYDDEEKWIDNIISVLDATMVGGILGRVAKGTAIGTRASEAVSEVVRNTKARVVKSRVQPTSLSQNYKNTNPDAARGAFDTVVDDVSGEAATALYGTNKVDAVGNDLLPEMGFENGSVAGKTYMPEKNQEVGKVKDFELEDFTDNYGALYAFPEEKAQARAAVVNRFQNVVGMNARKEMFQISEFGGGVKLRAVYGPANGGFANAEDAINMAEWALREEGVAAAQIKLLTRDGGDYREITKEEFDIITSKDVIVGGPNGVVRKPQDVLVAVDHVAEFRPSDVAKWAEADVKYNIFDRVSWPIGAKGVGSIQRHLVDIHSMLNPVITKGAAAQVDRAAGLEKQLLEMGEEFANAFSKAEPEIQGVMSKIIKEANEKSIEHSYAQLVAAGLRDSEIAAIKTWREAWDNMYRLENRDLARTLRAQNYQEFIDKAGDTRLFAKPIHRTQTGKVSRAYDPNTGKIVRLNDAQVKALYDAEGTFAKLRQPLRVEDEAAEFIIVENKPGSSYLKAISDNTQVLNYRKGYYAVRYTDPYFVIERVKDVKGNVLFERAVATAGSKKDAESLAKSKANNDGRAFNDDFFVREDKKKEGFAGLDHWDVTTVSGRSSQRIRGKRLEESDTNIADPSMSNILDPVDSLIASARSLAQRVSMRDMIETTKARALEQYKEFLPTGEFGQKVIPNDLSEIMYREGVVDKKKLADARTTFEYIRYLEDGYINHIDDTYKAVLKVVADVAGNAGLAKVDKAARWMAEGRGPSAMGKNLAFNLYLATNPARQFIVQSHQAMQLTANFPRWVFGGQANPQLLILTAKQLGINDLPENLLKSAGVTREGAEAMYKQFVRTGQVAAIDKQNLVRGSLLNLADQMHLGKNIVGRSVTIATSPITISRRLGFDAGENINTMTSWLAHRDDAIRNGLDMADDAVQADVAAKARNYTYNMNAAGDLPYNQNFLAAVFQFMQVPHKAILNMTTNRVMTKAQKARLAAFNATMYTLPPAAMISWFGEGGMNILPKDGEARDLAIQGLEGYVLNSLLGAATGQDSTVDWSGLSPVDMYGSMEFVHNLLVSDLGTIVAATPSGQLLFGNNPRLTNFVKTAARYVNLVDDYNDPTTFGQVAQEFAKMSSGYSNAFKAAYALEYNKKYNSLGGNPNEVVATPNAIALALGFQSIEDAQNRYVRNAVYNKSKDFEDDVKKQYKEMKAHIMAKHNGVGGSEFAVKMTSEAWRVFGNDNFKARQIFNQELKKDLSNKDAWLHLQILRDGNMMSRGDLNEMARSLKFDSDEQRKAYMDTIEYMNKLQSGE